MEKLPTIKIKGSDYVLVKDRLLYFHEHYPNGQIVTEILSKDNDTYIVKATIFPDVSKPRHFTGHSQAIIGGEGVNLTSSLENCETSAVGRALAMMGIGILESVASADEIVRAEKMSQKFQFPLSKKPPIPPAEMLPCPKCGQEWEFVPAGRRKSDGKAFEAYYKCLNCHEPGKKDDFIFPAKDAIKFAKNSNYG